jgi:uncharacterized protein (DUF4415 family)
VNDAVVTYTADELKQMCSASNWDAVDALTDEELTRAALFDPDNPPLDEETVSRMRPAAQEMPERERVTLSLNHEVIEFFRSCGQGWQNKLNDILQRYVDSQRAA